MSHMDASHPPLEGVHEASLYVHDLDGAERFWRGLGLPCIGRSPGRHVFFRAGADMLLVFHPESTSRPACGTGEGDGGSDKVSSGDIAGTGRTQGGRDANGPRTPVPPHGAEGAGHVALSVPDLVALEQWRVRLTQAGVAIEAEVTWPSGGRSIYFRDPAGNSLEFITRGSWGV